MADAPEASDMRDTPDGSLASADSAVSVPGWQVGEEIVRLTSELRVICERTPPAIYTTDSDAVRKTKEGWHRDRWEKMTDLGDEVLCRCEALLEVLPVSVVAGMYEFVKRHTEVTDNNPWDDDLLAKVIDEALTVAQTIALNPNKAAPVAPVAAAPGSQSADASLHDTSSISPPAPASPGSAGCGNAPTPTQPPTTYTVADVLDMAGVSDTTLNKYAKRAGVKTPGRGERDHRYSADEVRAILQCVIDKTSDRAMKERCRRALDGLPKPS